MVNFKSLLDKATSAELSEPDWEIILEIVEEIKTKSVTLKNAIKEFRRKLVDASGTTSYYTLCVIDSVMKNCASDVHAEVLSADFLVAVKGVVTSSKGDKAVDKALELVGEWKAAFGKQSEFKAINDTFSELEREGYLIPQAQVASAAFIQKAPEWEMEAKCHICRQEFNKLRGHWRHHCRNCGKSVCSTCSSKRLALSHYGLDQPTKVCDQCYKKLDKGEGASGGGDAKSSGPSETDSDLPPEYLKSSLASETQTPQARTGESKEQEEDDIQMAIAMSLNDQDNKQKAGSSRRLHSTPPPASSAPSAPPRSASPLYATIVHNTGTSSVPAPTPTSYYQPDRATESEDPNLAHYLDRSYWERRKEQQATAPTQAPPPQAAHDPPTTSDPGHGPAPVGLSDGAETTPLAETIRRTLEQFVQRMQAVSAGGKSVATDAAVLSMYQNLNAMQPQLLSQIDAIQQKKAHQEGVLQKLNEARQARVSLNSMRRAHQDRIRQQEQEQSILARMQMETKLALLRQQKQEQLEYQQNLQQKRLEALTMQRSEYERQIQAQRDAERQMLIEQEQQVLKQQFGNVHAPGSGSHPVGIPPGGGPAPYGQPGRVSPYGTSPVLTRGPLSQYQPGDPAAYAGQTLQLHDPTLAQTAEPLPTKLGPASSTDPNPPPYQPGTLQTDGLYQPPPFQPSPLGALLTSQPSAFPSLGQPSAFSLPQHTLPSAYQQFPPPVQAHPPPAQAHPPPAQAHPPPAQAHPPLAQAHPPPVQAHPPLATQPPSGVHGREGELPPQSLHSQTMLQQPYSLQPQPLPQQPQSMQFQTLPQTLPQQPQSLLQPAPALLQQPHSLPSPQTMQALAPQQPPQQPHSLPQLPPPQTVQALPPQQPQTFSQQPPPQSFNAAPPPTGQVQTTLQPQAGYTQPASYGGGGVGEGVSYQPPYQHPGPAVATQPPPAVQAQPPQLSYTPPQLQQPPLTMAAGAPPGQPPLISFD